MRTIHPLRALGLLAVMILAAPAIAHPVYATIGEAEVEPATRSLEVSLKVSVHDLEQAIGQRVGKVVSIDAPGSEAEVASYLAEVFVVRDTKGKRPLKWVGMEAHISHAWLYFEVPLPEALGGVTLANRIFFEQAPEQLNTLNVRVGGRLHTLISTPGQPAGQPLAPSKPAPTPEGSRATP